MALPGYNNTPNFVSSANIGIPGDEPINDFLVTTDAFDLQSSDNIFLKHS